MSELERLQATVRKLGAENIALSMALSASRTLRLTEKTKGLLLKDTYKLGFDEAISRGSAAVLLALGPGEIGTRVSEILLNLECEA